MNVELRDSDRRSVLTIGPTTASEQDSRFEQAVDVTSLAKSAVSAAVLITSFTALPSLNSVQNKSSAQVLAALKGLLKY